ncbi:ROK family transcriptional regulator [Lacicoccus alkaliphilus]|uniref:Sugar kinase of the NBD/HSP70 family, may contain an N-terminal HTH domain n=1 Tax=Lacicoccus alkaliphilus DSM 16010 TaxID=1123231 RepID=A0A1M7D0E6_9BACL|nr:ROK family transcriptional regulator [Salinicoccus alkaliphilus]SHL72934.1 Sugar kinase of the NBD/HSP70 family, may contain an N-terminal HTH domain [Salinicoccus alkaliphilus DSM 16010]
MVTGDANYIKSMNRRLVLEDIIRSRSISRVNIAKRTGLNKATVSSQVSSLINQSLVIEKPVENYPHPGRRPINLELNPMSTYTIGIDIDRGHIRIVLINLKGMTIYNNIFDFDIRRTDELASRLPEILGPIIKEYNSVYTPNRLAGIGISLHGIVNENHELLYAPPTQFELSPLIDMLKNTYQVPVYVDNNANMTVLAEKSFTDYQSNLFSVTLQSGIGLGILLNDEVFRGFTGYAGEVGHMIIRKNGAECRCGNKGCFEQYASDEVLKQALADHNISLHDHPTYASLMADQKTKAVIKDYISDLAVGLNNIINIFNPRKLVINSRIFTQYPELLDDLKPTLSSSFIDYEEILISPLGEHSSALGAALVPLAKFLDVNHLNLNAYR